MSNGSARRAALVNDLIAAEQLEYETRPSRRNSPQSLQSTASKHSGYSKSAERGGGGSREQRDPSTVVSAFFEPYTTAVSRADGEFYVRLKQTQLRHAPQVSSIKAAGQASTPPEIIRMHVGRTRSNNHFLDQAYEVVQPAGFAGDPATIGRSFRSLSQESAMHFC